MTTNTHTSDQQVTAENELREQVEALVLDLWIKYDNGNWFVNEEEDSDGRNNDHRFQDALVDGFMQLFAQAKQAWTVEARMDERQQIRKLAEVHITKTAVVTLHDNIAKGSQLAMIPVPYIDDFLPELQTPTTESEVEG